MFSYCICFNIGYPAASRNSVGLSIVIHDHSGYVIAASSQCFPGCLSLLNVELIVICEGLSFAENPGCELSVMECDSLVVINRLKTFHLFIDNTDIFLDVKSFLSDVNCGSCHFFPHLGN